MNLLSSFLSMCFRFASGIFSAIWFIFTAGFAILKGVSREHMYCEWIYRRLTKTYSRLLGLREVVFGVAFVSARSFYVS